MTQINNVKALSNQTFGYVLRNKYKNFLEYQSMLFGFKHKYTSAVTYVDYTLRTFGENTKVTFQMKFTT